VALSFSPANVFFHLGLFIFNPYGVVALPGPFPRFHLGLFIFNPYGVGAQLIVND